MHGNWIYVEVAVQLFTEGRGSVLGMDASAMGSSLPLWKIVEGLPFPERRLESLKYKDFTIVDMKAATVLGYRMLSEIAQPAAIPLCDEILQYLGSSRSDDELLTFSMSSC